MASHHVIRALVQQRDTHQFVAVQLAGYLVSYMKFTWTNIASYSLYMCVAIGLRKYNI